MKELRTIASAHYRKWVIFATLLMVTVAAAADALLPKLMGDLVNYGIMQNDVDAMRQGTVTFFSLALVGGIASYLSWLLLSIKGLDLEDSLHCNLGDAICGASLSGIESQQGTVITRMTSDVSKIIAIVPALINLLYRPVLTTFFCVFVVFYENIKLGLLVFLYLLIQIVLAVLFSQKTFPLFAKVQKMVDRVNGVLQEVLFNLRLVRISNAGEREKARFDSLNIDLQQSKMKVLYRISYFNPLVVCLMNIFLVLVIMIVGNQQRGDRSVVGNLMMVLAYSEQILMSILVSTELARSIAEVLPSIQRVRELLLTQATKESGVAGKAVDENIFVLQQIMHRSLNGTKILSCIELAANTGETVGILAASCSGKTLLSMIMAGEVLPEEGNVYFEGLPLRQMPDEQRKKRLAIVEDLSGIFDDTVRNNILLGRSWVTEVAMEKAVEATELHQYLSQLENGLDTHLFSNGMTLSGGERQRFMIARALAACPDVLILDNCTTSLDYCTERKILLNIRRQYPEMIVFFVTQRPQSTCVADRTFTLTEGSLVLHES